MMSGPAQAPRVELSLMVTVKTGPGIRVPDKASTKEDQKIPRKTIIEP
jgi:hypothetical protein